MKIIVFSDMHGNKRAVDVVKNMVKNEDADMVLYLGDYSDNKYLGDPKKNVEDIREAIKQLSPEVEFKSLVGNCDTKEGLEVLEKEGMSLHNEALHRGNICIVGFGGSNSTPFHTPLEFPEGEILDSLRKLMKKAEKFEPDFMILATHAPPKNTKCGQLPGMNVGSDAVRQVVEEYRPNLALCGHIHEAKSTDYIGDSKIVNVGPSSEGNFLIVEIFEDSIDTTGITI